MWARVNAYEGQWFLLTPDRTDSVAIAAAGIRFSDAVAEAGATDDAQERSMEQLELLADADVLLVTADLAGTGVDPTMDGVTGSPLWAMLPAAEAGNVVPAP